SDRASLAFREGEGRLSVPDQTGPHGLTEVEDGQIEGDEHHAYDQTQHYDSDRLNERTQAFYGRRHPLLVEVTGARQHLTALAGLLAGRGHLHKHLREHFRFAHRLGERGALFDPAPDEINALLEHLVPRHRLHHLERIQDLSTARRQHPEGAGELGDRI